MRKCLIVMLFLAVVFGGAGEATADPHHFGTKVVGDISYYDGVQSDKVRHKLDLYLPKGHKNFPVLFFVHGGGWVHGDKSYFGLFQVLGRTFNKHGIGVVSINYRLSPKVQHPGHIRDVARAFAWTHRNIEKYGGRADEIFVAGHSAGGHLVALLAADGSFLKEQKLTTDAIKGVIPISGVFDIPGSRIFDAVFGKNPKVRRQASPIEQANKSMPPFLILYAERDLRPCDRSEATAFKKALDGLGVQAKLLEVDDRNHISILLNAISDTDPATRAILSFLMSQVTFDRLANHEGAEALDDFGDFLARYAAAK